MGLLREWIAAYRDRTACYRDIAMIVSDAVVELASSRPEIRRPAISPPGDPVEAWLAEHGDEFTPEGKAEIRWAVAWLSGLNRNPATAAEDRMLAEQIVGDALLPGDLRTAWKK